MFLMTVIYPNVGVEAFFKGKGTVDFLFFVMWISSETSYSFKYLNIEVRLLFCRDHIVWRKVILIILFDYLSVDAPRDNIYV